MVFKAEMQGPTNYFWDESNRLRVVIQDAIANMQHYIYDASGQRILKASSNMEAIYENGMLSDQSSVTLDSYTTYPSAYIVLKGRREYTKHYYAGSQRIASRIGEEQISYFESQPQPRAASTAKSNAKPFDAEALKQLQIKDLTQILEKAKHGVPVFKPYNDKEESEEIDETPPATLKTAEDKPVAARAPEAPSQFPYNSIYFYHPDHLGTTSYLTDANGQPYQMFMNMPFGESLIEQHSLTEDYETPFKFNGKELDSETGLYYYGARYYDPRTSIWLSVDPLAEKYPNVNPYVYCVQNPVNLVDPDGMQVDDWVKNGNQWTWRSDITSKEQAIAAGFDDYSDGITNNTYQSGGQKITLGKDRNWTKGEEKFTDPGHALEPSIFSQLLAAFTGGSQVLETHNQALSASTRSDGNRDWAGYSAYTLWLDKINNFGGDMGSAATPSLSRRVTATGILQSFDDIVANPKFLLGRTADEIGSILGDGWTKGAYGSSKTGWKFMGPNDGQSIFFHPGGGRHGGSYYGFSSGKLGKTKVVGAGYKPLTGDKATIIE
jgi:RHS repeat-associated protein